MEEQISKHNLSRQQKTGFVLLLVFALLTVGLTFFQLRNTIYGPFVVRVSKEELQARESLQFDETVRLQQIDTDRDGINDYEELNFYETSPYLPDTDSDGIDDKVEIDSGKDPLCPEGTVCAADEFTSGSTTTVDLVSPLLTSVPTPDQILVKSQFDNTDASSTLDLNALLQDPAVIRQMLLSTGQITEEELAKIDDATLLKLAEKTAVQNFGIETNTSSSLKSSP